MCVLYLDRIKGVPADSGVRSMRTSPESRAHRWDSLPGRCLTPKLHQGRGSIGKQRVFHDGDVRSGWVSKAPIRGPLMWLN